MVTMKDVAAAAGVSSATVSNAYNRPSKLSATQRDHVFDVARKLGYSGPHPGASSLRTGSVGAIGLLITDWLSYAFEDPATTLLMRGIAQVSQMADISLTLLPGGGRLPSSVTEDQPDWPKVRRSVVDGFLIYSLPDNHPAVRSVLQRRSPVVIIDAPRVEGVPFVGIDDRAAARTAADHLVGLGHRRLGVLVDRLLPDGNHGIASQARIRRATDGVARERMRGIQDSLRHAGIPLSSVPVAEAGGFLFEEARPAVELLLDKYDLTGILATTDVLALTAMDVMKGRGIQIPEEMSVIGFDNLAEADQAGLTTIAQPLVEKGRVAAELILQVVAGKTAGTTILPTSLVERTSTAPANALKKSKRRSA
jgi:DNA-binding LacI/PurR family transcriptional regulator